MMQFTPLKDFFSEELKSAYCVGLSYQIRPDDKKLAALVPQWIEEGKVRMWGPVIAKVSGNGEVK